MKNRERLARVKRYRSTTREKYREARKQAGDLYGQQRYGEAQTMLLLLAVDIAFEQMQVTSRLYEQMLSLFPDHDTSAPLTESSVDREADEPAEVAETVGAAPVAQDPASAPHPNAPDSSTLAVMGSAKDDEPVQVIDGTEPPYEWGKDT